MVIENVLFANLAFQFLGIQTGCHDHFGSRLDGLEDRHRLISLHFRQIYINNQAAALQDLQFRRRLLDAAGLLDVYPFR